MSSPYSNKLLKPLALSFFFALLCATFSGTARAEGFSLSDWGARGTGLAGGMVGRADDPSAVAHNPAGITQLPGTQFLGGLTVITPSGQITTRDSGTEKTTLAARHWWFNPHVFGTRQISDQLWFGLGAFSRFGLGNSFPQGWPGSANLVEVKLKMFSLNPTLAWKFNEHLSAAFGVELMGGSALFRKGFATPLGYNAQKMTGMGASVGFNAALHYRFNEQWAVGLAYRSPINLKIRGENRWDRELGKSIPQLRSMQDCDVNAILHLPDSISFGLTWKPSPRLSFEAGTVYTVWSRYKHLHISMEGPVNSTAYADKHWKDSWNFNVSAEYKPLDWMSLRVGYSYETSPMNEQTTDYMTPTDGRHRIATGIGFNWDQWTVDLAYAYVRVNSLSYNGSDTRYVLDGKAHDVDSHVLAFSVGYKF